MEERFIVLVGGGGHCRSCIDVIETEKKYKIAGIVDIKEKLHQDVLDYSVTAYDERLPELVKQFKYFLITIGQVKSPVKRVEKFEFLKGLGAEFPAIISPRSHVSRHAAIGEGTVIMHNVVVNAGAVIGRNCIINTASVIEHDAVIGDHCHISTGAIINGGTIVGEGTFVGSNSMIREYIEIGEDSVIGGGVSVMDSLNPRSFIKGRN